jgi:hypothetical protein
VQTRDSNSPAAMAENLANCTASSATQCRSSPVSGRNLPQTGAFQMSAGDYRLFRSAKAQDRSPENGSQLAKSPPLAGLSSVRGTFSERRTAWLGREDSNLDFEIGSLALHEPRSPPADLVIGDSVRSPDHAGGQVEGRGLRAAPRIETIRASRPTGTC